MKGYFFNAQTTNDLVNYPTGYDKNYDAEDFAAFHARFFTDGVLLKDDKNACLVTASGSTLRITSGFALIQGHGVEVEGNETAAALSSGIVVIRWDKTVDVRAARLAVVASLVRTVDIWDLELARVTVSGGVATVRDTRSYAAYIGGTQAVEGLSLQVADMADSRRNYIRHSGNYIVGGSVGGIVADTGIAVEVCNGYIRFANTAGATGKSIYLPLSEDLAAGLTLTLLIRCRRKSTNTSTMNANVYSATAGVGPFNDLTPTSEFTTYIVTTMSPTTGISGRVRFSSTNFPNAGDTLDIANIALYEGTVRKAVWAPAPEDVGDMDRSIYDTDGDGLVDFAKRRYTNFIASGTDLNNLKQGGMLYVCGSYSTAATLSNCPVSDAFAMETYRTVAGTEALANGDTSISVLQRLYTYYDTSGQQIWQRTYYHGSGAWSQWYQIYHSGNIPLATTSQKGFVQLYNGYDSADTGKAPTAAALKAAKDAADTAINNLVSKMYPVGSIYMSTAPTNPSGFLGGTWEAWGAGRVPVGVNTSDSDFSAANKTGGAKTHSLTVSEMPSHTHGVDNTWPMTTTAGSTGSIVVSGATKTLDAQTGSAGGSGAHNNLQPYVTCYMWRRTA